MGGDVLSGTLRSAVIGISLRPRLRSARWRAPPRPPAPSEDDGLLTGLHCQVEQVGRNQNGSTHGAELANDVHRRLHAQGVDAVERLVEQQHVWFVEGCEDHGHPATHAVGEPGGDPVRHPEQVEPVEQVLGALLPSGVIDRRVAAS